MEFRYQAFNQRGELVEGLISGITPKEAKKRLKAQGLIPLKIEDITLEGSSHKGKIGEFELFRIFNQLSLLLRSGVSIDKALLLCQESFKEREIKSTLEKIIQDLRAGKELHQAFHETGLFPPLIVTFVRIGERTGNLKEAFSNIADYLLFQQKFKRELTNTLLYPVFLILASFIALLGVLKFIIPKFFSLFADNIDTLPLLSKIIYHLSLSITFKNFLLLFIAALVIYLLRKTPLVKKGMAKLKSILLTAPYIRSLSLDLDLSRFTLSLSHMLRSGLEFYQALSFAIELISHENLKESLRKTLPLLREGKTITDALSTVPQLPPFFIGALKVGEESGRLEEVFRELHVFYNDRFQNGVKRMVTLLEPLIITFVGLIVGLIVISLILTVMSVSQIKL